MGFFESLQAWHWAILGLLLFGAEMLGAGGFLIGAGAAAFMLAFVVMLLPDLSWTWQLSLYAFATVATSICYLRFFKNFNESTDHTNINDRASRLIGRRVEIDKPATTGQGRVQIDDTFWQIECDEPLNEGDLMEIVATRGMVLIVKRVERTG